jgi:hypothetical protein
MATLYFCVGCRTVHFDNDYCKEDGDLEILDFDAFLNSVELVKSQLGKNVTG